MDRHVAPATGDQAAKRRTCGSALKIQSHIRKKIGVMRQWAGGWSPPNPEPHSWSLVGWTDLSPQPPVTWQPSEGCMDLHSRFKVAFAEMALGGGFFGCEGGFSPHPRTTFLFTGGAGHRRIGCQVKDFRICVQRSPRMNPVRMKVSSSNFVPSRQCLHWAEDVVVGVKPVLLVAMMGALSPQKPGMLWSLRSSLSKWTGNEECILLRLHAFQ
eukprot:jgi/Bigna1/83680/fgenesh1_pg.113_\